MFVIEPSRNDGRYKRRANTTARTDERDWLHKDLITFAHTRTIDSNTSIAKMVMALGCQLTHLLIECKNIFSRPGRTTFEILDAPPAFIRLVCERTRSRPIKSYLYRDRMEHYSQESRARKECEPSSIPGQRKSTPDKGNSSRRSVSRAPKPTGVAPA